MSQLQQNIHSAEGERIKLKRHIVVLMEENLCFLFSLWFVIFASVRATIRHGNLTEKTEKRCRRKAMDEENE